MPAADRYPALRAAIRRSVPERPGVYTWIGCAGEKLYVGKSRHLRSRMLSYLHAGNLRPDARQRHLAQAIEAFEWRETPGELLALLLEDALIKELNPRHNERQKDYRERAYVLLTHDPFPTLLVVEQPGHRTGTLYGPFKDEFFARDLAELITDVLKLRACQDADPWRRSARYDLRQCAGPCRGAVTVDDYAGRVVEARTFLEGEASALRMPLAERMTEASDQLRFEEAAALRESMEFATRFAERQRFFREFESDRFVAREPLTGLEYAFSRGRLASVAASDGRCFEVPEELRSPIPDRRFLLDRANVVYSWTARTGPR